MIAGWLNVTDNVWERSSYGATCLNAPKESDVLVRLPAVPFDTFCEETLSNAFIVRLNIRTSRSGKVKIPT